MKINVNITIDYQLYNQLRDHKEKTGVAMSSYINKKMWEAVRTGKKEKKDKKG